MKLLNKDISEKLQEQFPMGSDFEQMVVAKFFDVSGSWSWYVMNQDPDDLDYLWGIVKGFEVEMGSFSLSELESVRGALGIGIERDLYFTPIPASQVWEQLHSGKHI